MALYSCVGVSATGVEWLIFYLMNQRLGLHYAPSTVIATVFSGFTNWAAGRLILFKGMGHNVQELGKIYLKSIISMGFNLLLMWAMVDGFGLAEMLAKVLATVFVFLWNYLIPTRLIYRGMSEILSGRPNKENDASSQAVLPEAGRRIVSCDQSGSSSGTIAFILCLSVYRSGRI